ncbi:MAG: DUF6056 family protein [Anaerolineales bacterium]|jgi:hypothetical protein|nr:DUF6056 family protein [Anaerolineales bacterium]
MKQSFHRILDALLVLQSLTGLAALSFLGYLGFFSRYWADDFCYLVTFENSKNIFDAIQAVYRSWSNRYTNILLVGLIDSFGPNAIRYLPGIMIGLLIIALSLTIYQLGHWFESPLRSRHAFHLGLFLTFFTILQTPNRFQSVYWMMGLVTYFAPLVFLGLITSLMLWAMRARLSGPRNWLALSGVAILTFLTGGLSETTLAFQVTSFGLFFLAVLLFGPTPTKRTALLFSGVALVASLLSLLVVFLAPGNAVRLENIPESEFSLSKIPLIVIFAFDFIKNSLTSFVVPTIVSVLSAFGLALIAFREQSPRESFAGLWRGLGAVPVGAFLLIASLVAPSVYVYGNFGYPEPRALFPAQFVLTGALMLTGFLLGRLAAQRLLPGPAFLRSASGMIGITILLLAVSAYPLWFLQKEIQILPQVQRYAFGWDERHRYLVEQSQQGSLDIVLDGIQPPGGLMELRQSPAFWVNVCLADFYDLNSIAVFP